MTLQATTHLLVNYLDKLHANILSFEIFSFSHEYQFFKRLTRQFQTSKTSYILSLLLCRYHEKAIIDNITRIIS